MWVTRGLALLSLSISCLAQSFFSSLIDLWWTQPTSPPLNVHHSVVSVQPAAPSVWNVFTLQ